MEDQVRQSGVLESVAKVDALGASVAHVGEDRFRMREIGECMAQHLAGDAARRLQCGPAFAVEATKRALVHAHSTAQVDVVKAFVMHVADRALLAAQFDARA